MATLATMIERLARRFNTVTALPADAAELTMIDTFESFGYKTDADVPVTDINRLLAFASAELATQVAINAASYFKYTDGEESVDKSMVSKQYRELAAQFRKDFAEEESNFVNVATTAFYRMPRRDRP
jgi:hypothetical protein